MRARDKLYLIIILTLAIQTSFSMDRFHERALFVDNPRGLSHIFFLDSLNTSFDPLSSQRIGYAFFKNDWMEYSSFKFKQAFRLAETKQEKDKVIFWYGLSYLRFGMLEELYTEMSILNIPWAKLWTGLALFDKGDTREAEKVLEGLLREREIDEIISLEAKYILGLCYLKQDRANMASEVFKDILEDYPHSILTGEINFRLALVEIRNGNLQNAIFALENCATFYDHSERKLSHWWIEEMYFLLSSLYIKTNDFEKARIYADLLEENFPDSDYLAQIMHIKLLASLSEKGLQDSSLLIPDDLPDKYKWDINMRIGHQYFKESSFEKAQTYFLGAISVAKSKIEKLQSFLYLGEVNYELEKYENAQKYFHQAGNQRMDFYRTARWGYAWSSMKLKIYDQARKAFEEVFTEYDDDLARRARFQYSMAYYFEGDNYKAVIELEKFKKNGAGALADDAALYALKAQSKLSDSLKYYDMLADFMLDYPYSALVESRAVFAMKELIDGKAYEKAIRIGEIMSKRDYDSLKIDSLYYYSMKAKMQSGEFSNMTEFLEDFVVDDADNHLLMDVFCELTDSLSSAGDYQGAIDIWDKLRVPEASDSIYALASFRQAQCLLALDDIYGAKPNIDQLIGELPESPYSPLGIIEIGKWFLDKNDYGHAVESFQKVKNLYPETIYEIKADLYMAKTYFGVDKYEEAREILSSIPRDTTENIMWEESVILMMDSYILEGTYKSALDYLDIIYDQVSPEVQCELATKKAVVNIRLGDIFKADSIFSSLSESEESCKEIMDGEFYYNWGEALSRTGQSARACSLLSIVYEEDNPDSLQREARKKVYEIQERSNKVNQGGN